MKNLFFIGGTMGVGKTTISNELKTKLDNCVYLDADNLWDAHPFIVNEETKSIVLNNIVYVLNNFINSKSYDNIIFSWVMDDKEIYSYIINRIDLKKCNLYNISLVCDEETLINRIEKDIKINFRDKNAIERSIDKISKYKILDTIKIDTSNKKINNIVDEIINLKG